MYSYQTRIFLYAAAIMLAATVAFGAVPNTISYQGQLLDSEGVPVTDIVPMTFAIYDSSTTGTELWSEFHPDVEVESGIFSVILGPIPDSVFSAEERWLEIVIDVDPIEPRTQLTSMPYTFSAKSVSGDITTGPGELVLSDDSKAGSFMQMRAHSSGNDMTMYTADPADESGFGMYDWNGGQPQALMEMKADAVSGGSFRIFGSGAGLPMDPQIYMGVEPSPFFDGKITLSRVNEFQNRDSAAYTVQGLRLYEENVKRLDLGRDGMTLHAVCGDGKGLMKTVYTPCGIISAEDTLGETLMVADISGFYVSTGLTKGDWDAFITPDSFKMSGGAVDGYVLTSDADGVGSWQAPTGGGGSGWTDDGDFVRLSNVVDDVVIGSTYPWGKLYVVGDEEYGVYAKALADTGVGGYFQGGESGVYGYVSGGDGITRGVYGRAYNNSTAAGYGVSGFGHNGVSPVGVRAYGEGGTHTSTGLQALAAGSGPFHTAVYAYASNADSINIGVETEANEQNTKNYGVYSTARGTDATNYGMYTVAWGGETNYGIYATGTSYAGYFAGDVHITGTLTGGKASTRIDHPLDPENKYLQQSFVESPDMKSVYDGNVITDANGLASVELPEYCEALNRDFRYQLTAIGSFSQVIVKQEIENNQFVIASAQPNVKVSWQVTGIRKDAFAEANRTQVEINKPDNERGLYMYPEALGYGEEMQIHYQ